MGRRRANGEGTTFFLRPGRSGIYSRVRLTDPATGQSRRVLVSGASETELTMKIRKLVKNTRSGVMSPRATMITLGSFADHWADTHLEARDVSDSTRVTYRRHIKNHIKPVLGYLRLSTVRPADVERLDAHLRRLGRSDSLRRSVHNILSLIYATAVRDELVTVNPCDKVPRPVEQRRRQPQYTPAQIRTLLDTVRGERILAELVPVLTWTAMRIGEALALRWEDVHLDTNAPLLWVNGTIAYDRRSRAYRQDWPKDKDPRPVPLVPAAVAALKAARKAQAAEQLAVGQAWQDSGLVFTTTIGTLIDPRNLRRQYSPLVARAGLTGSFHALRRSTATMLSAARVPTNIIAAILGHSSSAVTEQRYIIVNTDMVAEAMDRLDAYWADTLDGEGA